jgi:hypothetical protein
MPPLWGFGGEKICQFKDFRTDWIRVSILATMVLMGATASSCGRKQPRVIARAPSGGSKSPNWSRLQRPSRTSATMRTRGTPHRSMTRLRATRLRQLRRLARRGDRAADLAHRRISRRNPRRGAWNRASAVDEGRPDARGCVSQDKAVGEISGAKKWVPGMAVS